MLVADGFELVLRKQAELPPGASSQEALAGWLACRLRDRWRTRHRERRRNARGGTAYSVPVPTGLAWEHGEGAPAWLPVRDDQRLSESRLALASLTREQQLRDPREIGQYVGVPSWRPLATVTARELWGAITEERQLTSASAASQLPRFAVLPDVL